MVAAVLADGETILENSAREPEVTDLVIILRKMGAKIEGDDTSTLRIQGVDKLHGTEHSVIPDRIEAGTFLVAGALTGGDLTITDCAPEHLGAVIAKMQQAGVRIDTVDKTTLRVRPGEETGRRRHDHRGISGLRNGHAGAVHGAGDAGGRHVGGDRNHFREPLLARQRDGAHGREHFHRWAPRFAARRAVPAIRQHGAGVRSASKRGAGPCGVGGEWRDSPSTACTTSTAATSASSKNCAPSERISNACTGGGVISAGAWRVHFRTWPHSPKLWRWVRRNLSRPRKQDGAQSSR